LISRVLHAINAHPVSESVFSPSISKNNGYRRRSCPSVRNSEPLSLETLGVLLGFERSENPKGSTLTRRGEKIDLKKEIVKEQNRDKKFTAEDAKKTLNTQAHSVKWINKSVDYFAP
jgi:hypothetical protein